MIDFIAAWICRHFHKPITRPIHAKYMCLVCGREIPTAFK